MPTASRASSPASPPDERLLEATVAVLAEAGWHAVTLERIAERAGRSRVTLWRQGISQQVLLGALLDALADDFTASVQPVLAADGTGRERLAALITALCKVIDRHLPLVLASDEVFHQGEPGTRPINYLDPFIQLVRAGNDDGTLFPRGSVDDVAQMVFNCVAWTYTHMRGRHHWSPDRARRLMLDLVLRGVGQP